MKALKQIGFKKAFRFFTWTLIYGVFRLLPYPPLRVIFLRLFGAKIGKNTVIHAVRFFNYYRGTFKALEIGDDCFIGSEVLFDLASPAKLGAKVTLAERVCIITHLNVGYEDHPLQKNFPSTAKGVTIEPGCFVGVNAVILDGVTIGTGSFVAASSLVKDNIPAYSLVGGVPAKVLKKINENT